MSRLVEVWKLQRSIKSNRACAKTTKTVLSAILNWREPSSRVFTLYVLFRHSHNLWLVPSMSLNLAPTLNEAMKKPSKDKPKVPNNHLPDTSLGQQKRLPPPSLSFLSSVWFFGDWLIINILMPSQPPRSWISVKNKSSVTSKSLILRSSVCATRHIMLKEDRWEMKLNETERQNL